MNTEPMLNNHIAGWVYAVALAGVAFLLLLVIGGFGWIAAAFFAAIVVVGVGGLISAVFCGPLPKPGEVGPPGPKVSTKPMGAVAHAPAAPKPAPAAKVAQPAPATPKAAAKKTAKPKTTGGASQPAAMAAARGGSPDNLKELKGVGPKLETLLHDLGIFHFDQIAGWGPDEVAWMDDNLKGFKGRVTRDDWVNQAKILAAGGETSFSKRVEEGDVY